MTAPRSPQRPPAGWPVGRGAWALWALAIAALFLCRLGAAPLFDVDEGAFAEATREMLASGDWWSTTLNGAPRFDKPILVYWLQALSVGLLGRSDFAVRLPSALCGIAWCLGLARFLAPRVGAAEAMAGGGLLACALGPLLIGRAATADALLNVLLALAMFDLWRHLEGGARAPLRRAALWIGLGVLTKGPVALLVPGAVLLLWSLWQRSVVPLKRACSDPLAWLILLVVAVPWYVYALLHHGQAFIDGFVLRHNVQRFTGTLEGHGGGFAYYAVVLPLLALPWLPWLVPALRALRRRDPLHAWLALWAGFVVGFFSLSGTKLPHYVLYGFTPLAAGAGWALVRRASRGMLVAGGLFLLLTLALLGALPPLLATQAARVPDPLPRTLLQTMPPWPAWTAVLALVLAVVAALVWRRAAPGLRMLAATAIVAGWVVAVAHPWWGEAAQGPLRTLAAVARDELARTPGGTVVPSVVQWRANQPSFAWMLGQPTPGRDPLPGELALVRVDRLPAGCCQLIREARGFALVRRLQAPAPAPASSAK